VTGPGDDVAERFRAVLSRRHFVDREPGVLLVWLPANRSELAELVPKVEARHPGTRIAVHEAGAAVARPDGGTRGGTRGVGEAVRGPAGLIGFRPRRGRRHARAVVARVDEFPAGGGLVPISGQ
jgi:hypothetical protein